MEPIPTQQTLEELLAIERGKTAALVQALDEEKARRMSAEEALKSLRHKHEHVHNNFEAEEENIVNKLMCKIDQTKREKEMLANELEQEEEFLTNNLQKQLTNVKKDKEAVQNEVTELRRQLEHMKADREKIARQVEAEEEFISNAFIKKLREVQCEKNELETRLWEKRLPSSRSSSLAQSRSSSFSVDNSIHSVGSADTQVAGQAAHMINASSTDFEDHISHHPHHPHPVVHPMHIGNNHHFHGSNSAPSSLFSTPRDY